MIYDYFRASGADDTVLDNADLFSIKVRNDSVQEFDSRRDHIPLSMMKIPSDDILESLYKLRIRESGQLKTVPELYDMEIHQKISMLVPSSRRGKYLQLVARRKNQAARTGKWSPRGPGMTVLTYP